MPRRLPDFCRNFFIGFFPIGSSIMERNIEVVYVAVRAVRVASFSVPDRLLEFLVRFNDGKERELRWKARIGEPRLMAARLFSDIIGKVEGEHTDFDGESLTNSPIVLLQDKVGAEAAVTDFFQEVYARLKGMLNSSAGEGYLRMVAGLRSAEVVL